MDKFDEAAALTFIGFYIKNNFDPNAEPTAEQIVELAMATARWQHRIDQSKPKVTKESLT